MLARCLLAGDKQEEVRIFYSYSRADAEFREQVDRVLSQFKWDVDVRAWYDGEIPAGQEWEDQIFRHIDVADVILLFITNEFLSSEYCVNVEMPRALKLHEQGQATVIPILVDSTESSWHDLTISKLQVLPNNGVPIAEWPDQDKALKSVIQGIVNIIVNSQIEAGQRSRWHLYIEGSPDDLNDVEELTIVEEIRTISLDTTARPLAIGEGNIVIFMESSREALLVFKDWFREQDEPMLAGRRVLQIIELFGAGVQAKAQEFPCDADIMEQRILQSDLLLFPSKDYVPVMVKGITISEENPLKPDFIIDTGDSKLEGDALVAEHHLLVEYFMTSVAVPEDEQWVNLGPDEKNRMLGKSLAGTAMGRDLLDTDFKLKRLAASLMHPDCETGREFWQEVFKLSTSHRKDRKEGFNTFQRVWLVPEKAGIYEPDKKQAFVYESYIKVMCEDDYHSRYSEGQTYNSNDICTPLFKRIILPVIEKEVNTGKNFSRCRQLYNCMFLATWLKIGYREHSTWSRYINTGNPHQLASSISAIKPIKNLIGQLGLDVTDESKQSELNNIKQESELRESIDLSRDDIDQKTLDTAIRLRIENNLDDSCSLLEGLVERSIKLRGKSIQFTQEAMSQLGRTLREMGKFIEAKSIHQEVWDIRRFVLGVHHPYTINSMEILAETMEINNEIEPARNLKMDATELRSRFGEAFEIEENREYYEKYMSVFREGVFNLVRDEFCYEKDRNLRVTRSYFSGAIDFRQKCLTVTT